MANYAFTTGKPLPTVENGHTFVADNFTQALPHTTIFEGVTGLTFRNCNLNNCDIPVDAVEEGCGHIHLTFCTNIHPEFIGKGVTTCDQVCEHVVDTDVVTIDGIPVDTIYHYKNKAV